MYPAYVHYKQFILSRYSKAYWSPIACHMDFQLKQNWANTLASALRAPVQLIGPNYNQIATQAR